MSRLPARLSDVLFLRYRYDLTESEMARVLRCPPGTVKSRLNLARRALADAWRSPDARSGSKKSPNGSPRRVSNR